MTGYATASAGKRCSMAKLLAMVLRSSRRSQMKSTAPLVSKNSARWKPAGSVTRLAKKGLPYISVLTDPTMGGVSAGFAFLGAIVIAEPKARVGFAGPRVIESTVRVTLPEGFQRAEFLLTKGAVDFICDRRELRSTIARSLAMLQRLPADAVA